VSEGGYCDIYGRLYKGGNVENVCPDGWHLPSKEEWDVLLNAVGGASTAGTKLKSKSGWMNYEGKSGNGTDDYGFTAIPGGGGYGSIGNEGCYGQNGSGTVHMHMDNTDDRFALYSYCFEFSIRCIKDGLCGSQIFDALTQFCDNNTVYDLCGGKTYQPANQRCGTGNIIETQCGTGWYDATNVNQRCENGIVETKCGNSWYSSADYNPKTQFCSNGTIKSYGKLTDTRDSKTYKTVEIGTQIWMAENLNYNATSGKSYCYDNCEPYGRLYEWSTAITACPSGWRLPSDADWNVLMKFINPSCSDNKDCAGAGTKLKAISGWNSYEGKSGNGTDDYGFSALPGGQGNDDGTFFRVGNGGTWWSSSEFDSGSNYAHYRTMGSGSENVIYSGYVKWVGYSVRCVKD